MNTLIAYASKYGSTEKCAGMISRELNSQADVINLKETKDVDLSKYDRVIIGGSVYIGKIQNEAAEFCKKNLDKLKEKQLGLFICGMQEDKVLYDELNANFPKELLDAAKAKDCLGGEFLIDKMSFMDKMIVKKVSKVTTNKSNISEEKIKRFAQSMS
jgi:menaquinone-dependent protoporphyrinogen oxidase